MNAALAEELALAVHDVRVALPPDAAPKVGLILGSGLGDFAAELEERTVIGFTQITGFPPSTIAGHSGNLVYGRHQGGLEVLVLQGRVHGYEGHDLARVAFPARVLVACGCSTLVLTNAAGGVAATLAPGQIVILSDHLNLMGSSPLKGPNDDELGPRFPDMSEAYPENLRAMAKEVARDLGLSLKEGVYLALSGPAYETPAEIRMLRVLGADGVGMSTVPEVIAMSHMGIPVLGISCITNMAAGVIKQKLTHQEVMDTTARVQTQFTSLVLGVLKRL